MHIKHDWMIGAWGTCDEMDDSLEPEFSRKRWQAATVIIFNRDFSLSCSAPSSSHVCMLTTLYATCIMSVGAVLACCTHARTNIAIVATGRSGSTLLMNALAALPHSVHLFEPYFTPESMETALGHAVISAADTPSPYDLFTCSDRVYGLDSVAFLSKFACESTPWIAETAAEVAACAMTRINSTRTMQRCREASSMIIKILQLPWLARKLSPRTPVEGVIPQGTRVIHLVRHPAVVLRSQYTAGWDELHYCEQPSDAMTSCKESPLERLAAHICTEMDEAAAVLAHYEQSHVLVLRYEELVVDYEGAMRRVLHFVKPDQYGTDDTDDELLKSMVEVKLRPHAQLPSNPAKTVSIQDALAVVSGIDVCLNVLQRFYSS